MFGLADGEPAQAVMVPVTGPAVITGASELTVMVKVTGMPEQPDPLVIKFPNGKGPLPAGIVNTTFFVAAFIIEILFPFALMRVN